MSKLEKCLEDLAKIESFLEKMELTTPDDAKKAEELLQKISSFASKEKYLAGNFNHFSGIICFLKKDFKKALTFFSKSIELSAVAGTSHGYDHLWKAYTHLALNETDSTYEELKLAYKTNKKIITKLKWMKAFENIKETAEYKKALGIKSGSDNVDAVIQKITDYVLENSNCNYLQVLSMIEKDKLKIKDKSSLYDATIWTVELILDDALEHELRDQDFYDEGSYTVKQLKEILKSSKEERKKLGRGQSYFHKIIKNNAA